jgi:hypothetical protein
MIGDVRVSREDASGALIPYETVGLRKIYGFSNRTVVGFAGDVDRAWRVLGSVNAYMRANGYDEPRLIYQLKGWVNDLCRHGDELTEVVRYQTDLLFLRTSIDPPTRVVVTSGVRVSLPSERDEKPRVRSFFLTDHIGSGSGIPAYRQAVEEARKQLSGWAGFEQAMPGRGVSGQLVARGLSDVIMESKEASVSPDVDICVLSARGVWAAGLRRSDPPLHVCQTWPEFQEDSGDEGRRERMAIIG